MPPEDKKIQPPVPESKIDGDMKSEEPLGWDQAPQNIDDPGQKRHPRIGGRGGIGKPLGSDDKHVEGA